MTTILAINQLTLLAGLFGSLLLVGAFGRYLGKRRSTQCGTDAKSFAMTILGASLGLMGLILGFTFSMAVNRYNDGKALVASEANAVGTAYLRSKTLPKFEQQQTQAVFEKYADTLLAHYALTPDMHAFNESLKAIQVVQSELWSQAKLLAERNPQMVPTGIYLQALNEMFDRASDREQFIRHRVPEVIFGLLGISALLTMGLSGYVSGLSEGRGLVMTSVFSLLIVMVIGIIIDLDRPRRGLIQVDAALMSEVRAGMSP